MKISLLVKKYLHYGLLIVVVLAMILLVVSIIKSAYYYQYDYDELYHVQRTYLIASGLKPYTSFYFIYTSIFQKILMPFFSIFGFSFATLGKVRIFMVLIFAVRVVLTALLINKIFNRRAALLFLPLFLFDPITIFSSMQIRPDNLMMIVYILGLLVFITGFLKSTKLLLFLSGSIFGLSFLILLKIAPQLVILFIIYGIYCVLNREFKNFILFIDGFILALVLFFLYHIFDGSFIPMFKQVFIIPFALPNALINKTYYGFFYQPDNGFIYGLMEKPLTWYYVWILPLLASAGAYLVLPNFSDNQQKKLTNIDKKKLLIKIFLIVSLVVQYMFLLKLDTVFIQYYIPFQWLLALFSAVMIDDLIFKKFKSGFFHKLIKGGFIILFIILVYVSIQANNARTVFRSEYENKLAPIWSQVPPNAAIFPSILFRPIAFPLSIGDDQLNYNNNFWSVKDMFSSYVDSFEKNKLPYMLIDEPTKIYALEPGLEKYIKDHYQKIDNQINLYKRVK